MSTTVRTRRSSQPASRRRARTYVESESSYDSYRDQRDEITTNDAPAWQSQQDQRTSFSRRRPEGSTSKRTTVNDVGKSASVKPSDSISRAPPRSRRWDDGDDGYSTRRTNVSTRSRRPKTFRRYSSEDADRWSTSRAAPLTVNNLEEFNDVTSEATRRSQRTARRRSSSAQGGGATRIERWRQSSGTATQDGEDERSTFRTRAAATNVRGEGGDDGRSQARSVYRSRAATNVQDDQDGEEVIRTRSKTVYQSNVQDRGEEVSSSRPQAQSVYNKSRAATNIQDDQEYERTSRYQTKSTYQTTADVPRSRRDSALETTAIAAGGAAAATTFSDARRRRTTDDYNTNAPSQSHATARRASQAPAATTTSTTRDLALVRTQDPNPNLAVVEARGSRAAPPPMPEFGQPYDTNSSDVGRRSESPPEMEWEKQTRIREFVRPSDGKVIEVRECLVRRIRPVQVEPEEGGSVGA